MNRALRAGLHLTAFLFATGALVLGLGIGVAVALLASGSDATHPEELLDAAVLGGLSAVQILGLAGVATLLGLALPLDGEASGGSSAARLRATYPSAAAPRWLAAAALGGTMVWTLPTWLSEHLAGWLSLEGVSALELVAAGLSDPSLIGRAVLVFAITVTAPICEELAFRGYVWRVLASGSGPIAAFVGSTALFALYHADPVHTLSLVPTAAFLGWLRLRSGSVAPGMVAHFVNNGIAVLASFTWPEDAEVSLPLALAGAAGTLAVVGIGELGRARG